MKVGFTGTRHGLTRHQVATLRHVLAKLFSTPGEHTFTHGDCVGADACAHQIVRTEHANVSIRILPSNIDVNRAFCEGAHVVEAPSEPLRRNEKIVRLSDVVVACPSEPTEMSRGGTWFTVRAARKAKRELYIILPDGRIDYDL